MSPQYVSNLLVTGEGVGLNVIDNFTFYIPGLRPQAPPPSTGGACVKLTAPEDVTMTRNYVLSSGESGGCVGERAAFWIENGATGTVSITGNTFVGALDVNGVTLGSDEYYDPGASDCNDLPTTNKIVIRPVNDYRFNATYKRAHIAIYNWENSTSVSLPAATLSDVNGLALATGDPYEIYDIQTVTMDEIVTQGPVHALASSASWDGNDISVDLSAIDVNDTHLVVHESGDGVVDRVPHTAPGFLVLLLIKPGDYDGDDCIDRDDTLPLCDNSTATDGDMDCDGDVDTADFAVFAQCFAGANNPPAAGCPCGADADFDDDDDVDTGDFAILAQNFSGSGTSFFSTPAPPAPVASPGDRITIGIDDSVGANPNQGTYAENSGAKISYEIFVSIDELGDGPDSQGVAGLVVDILTDTGIQQPKPSFSATSTAAYAYAASDQLWIGGKSPTMTGGFGFNGNTSTGNNNTKIGSVIGAGVHMKTDWDADVAPEESGLQPRALHNVGFGTPPGTDVGGNTVPASDARSKWYLFTGEINVPDSPGTYKVEVDLQALSLIRSGVDLNDDQTEGYVIGIEQNGDTFVEDSFTFTVTDD